MREAGAAATQLQAELRHLRRAVAGHLNRNRVAAAAECVRSVAGMAVSCLFYSTPSNCMNTGVTSIAVHFGCYVPV